MINHVSIEQLYKLEKIESKRGKLVITNLEIIYFIMNTLKNQIFRKFINALFIEIKHIHEKVKLF